MQQTLAILGILVMESLVGVRWLRLVRCPVPPVLALLSPVFLVWGMGILPVSFWFPLWLRVQRRRCAHGAFARCIS